MATKSTDIAQDLLSDLPIPSGETVLEGIQYLGMTRHELAEKIGVSPQSLDDLIEGEMPVTQKIAEELEQVLGIPAYMLVRLEQRYRRTVARRRGPSIRSS